jgi:hypothetical protein
MSLAGDTGTISGTPAAAGSYIFTATATNTAGSDSKQFLLIVKQAPPVPVVPIAIIVSPNEKTIEVGATVQIKSVILPYDANQEVTYTNSDSKVVSVSTTGLIKAVAAGTATITVKSKTNGNIKDTVVITVKNGATPKPDPKPKDTTAALLINSSYAVVNSKDVVQSTGSHPKTILVDGKTMVPFRFVATILGYKVNWDAKTKSVSVKSGDKTVVLPIGSKKLTVTEGTKKSTITASAAAVIINGNTYVPFRVIAEAFGSSVKWHAAEKVVTISSNEKATTANHNSIKNAAITLFPKK